jgi:hypothetical protein
MVPMRTGVEQPCWEGSPARNGAGSFSVRGVPKGNYDIKRLVGFADSDFGWLGMEPRRGHMDPILRPYESLEREASGFVSSSLIVSMFPIGIGLPKLGG